MIPPTPTLIPESFGSTGLELDLGVPSMWELAPEAVQTWNQFGQFGEVIKVLIIAFLIGLAVFIIYRFFKRLNEDEATA